MVCYERESSLPNNYDLRPRRCNSDDPEPSAAPAIGRISTDQNRVYDVIESLGDGAHGAVKRCVDRETGATCALKIVSRSKRGGGQRHLEQHRAEATLLKKFANCEHVLGLDAAHEHAEYEPLGGAPAAEREHGARDVAALVLELCRCDLFTLVATAGGLDEPLARSLFHQLVRALGSMHAEGCFHRDVKAENVMIAPDGSVRLGDFNLAVSPPAAARLRDGGKQLLLSTEVGSRGYMAPEVIAAGEPGGGKYAGAPADLWSAGVVLFTMLAGHPPFQMAAKDDWYFKRCCASARPDTFWKAHEKAGATFSPGAKNFLTKLLVADPAMRATLEDLEMDPWLAEGRVLERDELSAAVERIMRSPTGAV